MSGEMMNTREADVGIATIAVAKLIEGGT